MKALTNCSGSETSHLVRLGTLIAEIPECGRRLHAGEIGVTQASELARVRRNPRCGDQLAEIATTLLDHAATLPFADFKLCVRRWVMLADPDGAYKERELGHENRDATVHEDDGGLHLRAEGGTAAIAAEMLEIFERFRTAEFLTDWDAAVAEHTSAANASQLARTDAQRRFDTVAAIFRAAANAPLDARVPEPTVNFVVDQQTFEEHLARTMGDASAVVNAVAAVVDPVRRRCETPSGTLVHPDDVLAASLIGHVRRVVYDSAGNVIDLGRRRRLFSGAARDAVMLQSRRCLWPGCDLPVGRCQADHVLPWAALGSTAPDNGGPACRRHNQFKNRGFTTRRDASGHWHVFRPDGTELTEPECSAGDRGAAGDLEDSVDTAVAVVVGDDAHLRVLGRGIEDLDPYDRRRIGRGIGIHGGLRLVNHPAGGRVGELDPGDARDDHRHLIDSLLDLPGQLVRPETVIR